MRSIQLISRRLFGKKYGLSFLAVDKPVHDKFEQMLAHYDKTEGMSSKHSRFDVEKRISQLGPDLVKSEVDLDYKTMKLGIEYALDAFQKAILKGRFDSTKNMFNVDNETFRQTSIDKWKCLLERDQKIHKEAISKHRKYVNSIRYKLVVDEGHATLYLGAKCYHRYDHLPSVLDNEDTSFISLHEKADDAQAIERHYINRYYVEMSQTLLNFKQPELVNGEWHLTNVSWPINSSEEFYSFYGAYRQSFLI